MESTSNAPKATGRLILVRHGETDGNRNRVVQLPTDSLNEHGRRQAKAVGQRLAGTFAAHPSAVLFTSDHARASETAQAIATAASREAQLQPLLRERDFGDFRGRPYDDIGFDIMGPDVAPPSGETWPMFFSRVDRLAEALRQQVVRRDVVAVTHGLVLHGLALRHFGLNEDTLPERWGNTSVSEVDVDLPGFTVLNCTRHLDSGSTDHVAAISGI